MTSFLHRLAQIFQGWPSDVILWGVVLCTAGIPLLYAWLVLPQHNTQTIELDFRDINEITRGASVRMMGTDIGFVKKIKLNEDQVHVTIQTYPDSPAIPEGSTFTVLFTGLAGSKSIEVLPPAIAEPPMPGKPAYKVQMPMRLQDAYNAQVFIAQALKNGADNFTEFFGQAKGVPALQENVKHTAKQLEQGVIKLQHARADVAKTQETLHQAVGDIDQVVSGFSDTLTEASGIIDPPGFKQSLQGFATFSGRSANQWVPGIGRWNRQLQAGTEALTEASATCQAVLQHPWLAILPQPLARFNSAIEVAQSQLPTPQQLYSVRACLQRFNHTLQK